MNTGKWPWRILLIEDNPADQLMIERSLKRHGLIFDLVKIHDGNEAVKFFEDIESGIAAPSPELVILDLHLPYRGGLELVKRLRSSEQLGRTPVVIISGAAGAEEHFESARKYAPTECFEKRADYESFLEIGLFVKKMLEDGVRKKEMSA